MARPAAPHGIFISRALPVAAGIVRGALRGGKEGHVKNIDIARVSRPPASRDEAVSAGDPGRFPPAAFVKDAGTVIAVCLVLGLLMQVLLG
jgi:hypothetical protein